MEEGASDEPLRAVFVELKEPDASGRIDRDSTPVIFPDSQGRQVLDNDRTTVTEFIPTPAAGASPHRHARDAVVVSFTGLTPRVTFVRQGTVHNDEGTAGADRAYVFELK